MEFERRINLCQPFSHGEDRRHAYAAREQNASACIALELEQVARLTDGNVVALLDAVVHEGRATAGVWVTEYRDEIAIRSEEHTSELQSLMRISYAVFCLNKKTTLTKVRPVRRLNRHTK